MPQPSDSVSPGEVWSRHTVLLGGDPVASAASGRELDERYAQGHRRYHDGRHVTAVLRDSATLADALQDVDRDLLALAACAHDIVYAAEPGEDERRSAEWARAALRAAGVSGAAIDRVSDLVLATAAHACDPEDHTAVALLDADLAILGADPEDYRRYADGVRAEYAAASEDAWRTGRSAVLADFLDRRSLFLSAPARDRWEPAARRNLRAELDSLAAVR